MYTATCRTSTEQQNAPLIFMSKYNNSIFEDKYRSQVIDLWDQSNLIKSWNDPNKDIDRKLKVNDNLFLIVEFNEIIIGSAMGGYDGHRGSIYYLSIDPKYQNKGVGKILMKEIEKRLIAVGCPKINIFIRNSNIVNLGKRSSAK